MPGQAVLIVSYPSTSASGQPAKFDMNYYTNNHMSLIAQHWTPHGMQDWTITSLSSSDSLDGKTPPYCVQATVTFDSIDSLKSALMNAGKETGADVVNYTDVTPEIWISRLEAEEKECQAKGK